MGDREGDYLVLFEDTPFLTALELASLAVLAPLDGVAHGGHGGVWDVGCGSAWWMEGLRFLGEKNPS